MANDTDKFHMKGLAWQILILSLHLTFNLRRHDESKSRLTTRETNLHIHTLYAELQLYTIPYFMSTPITFIHLQSSPTKAIRHYARGLATSNSHKQVYSFI